mmetsp:Transcript_6433/g.11460  ORF Transcript_6433/g.11460 Transcript_6433/m.11460 type:complete len:203 (+) Transcript_6433:416-1024(+)
MERMRRPPWRLLVSWKKNVRPLPCSPEPNRHSIMPNNNMYNTNVHNNIHSNIHNNNHHIYIIQRMRLQRCGVDTMMRLRHSFIDKKKKWLSLRPLPFHVPRRNAKLQRPSLWPLMPHSTVPSPKRGLVTTTNIWNNNMHRHKHMHNMNERFTCDERPPSNNNNNKNNNSNNNSNINITCYSNVRSSNSCCSNSSRRNVSKWS